MPAAGVPKLAGIAPASGPASRRRQPFPIRAKRPRLAVRDGADLVLLRQAGLAALPTGRESASAQVQLILERRALLGAIARDRERRRLRQRPSPASPGAA